MKLLASILVMLFLAVGARSQQNIGNRDRDIPLLNAGTKVLPIKLSKQWFEGDTIYVITFRKSRRNTTDHMGSQGFFKPELKEFGHALKATLAIDSTKEVIFSNGTMIVRNEGSRKRYMECTFSSGAGTFRAKDKDVQKLVSVIERQ